MSNSWRMRMSSMCLGFVVLLMVASSAFALVVPHRVSLHGVSPTFYTQCSRHQHYQRHHSCFQQEEPTEKHGQHSRIILHDNGSSDNGIIDRFVNPKIDDPWLPLNEAGVAQIVAPSFEIFWTILTNSPYPSWATTNAVFATRGAFLAPTLIHGAALACCWLAGCLAAKAYEKEAYEGDIGTVIFSTIKAGAFASGLLILSTQLDLFFEFGGYVQYGDSPETDVRILAATVELVNDIVFEAVILLSYRIYRSMASFV